MTIIIQIFNGKKHSTELIEKMNDSGNGTFCITDSEVPPWESLSEHKAQQFENKINAILGGLSTPQKESPLPSRPHLEALEKRFCSGGDAVLMTTPEGFSLGKVLDCALDLTFYETEDVACPEHLQDVGNRGFELAEKCFEILGYKPS